MKTRTGFVSNSSSSSFIIGFDKKPESSSEMKEALFFNKEHKVHPYAYGGMRSEDVLIPTSKIADTVFLDIEDQEPLTEEKMAEVMGSGWDDDAPDSEYYVKVKFGSEEYDKQWGEFEKASEEYYMKKTKEFLEANKGKVFFEVTYSDNEGTYFCALEHGNIFESIVHIRISQH